MHKISLVNPCLAPANADRASIYQMYKDMGIDGLDYSLFAFTEKNGYEPAIFKRSSEEIIETVLKKDKELLDLYGLEVCQTHSPFPVWRYGEDKKNQYRLLENLRCIELTAYLGCRYVIIHPITESFRYLPAELRERNLDFYSQLIDTAKKHGVVICLENMWNARNRNIFECTCEDPYETNDYIDTLNKMAGEDIFGFCFDVGHATLCGRYMKNTLITLGGRVKALHIHDANKISDLHTLPFSQCDPSGSAAFTDYTGLLEGLRAIEYRGAINFEAGNAFRVFPAHTHKALLGLFRSIGEYFSMQITDETK